VTDKHQATAYTALCICCLRIMLQPTFPPSPYIVRTPHTPIKSPSLPGLVHCTDSNGLSAGVQTRLDPSAKNERTNASATNFQSQCTSSTSRSTRFRKHLENIWSAHYAYCWRLCWRLYQSSWWTDMAANGDDFQPLSSGYGSQCCFCACLFIHTMQLGSTNLT